MEAVLRAIALSLLVIASPFAVSIVAVAETPPPLEGMSPTSPVPVANRAPQNQVYADGTYIGPSVDAYYGNVQMQVSIQGGRVSGFTLLDYPHHTNTSVMINRQALPMLATEVIAAQSANVDVITGATLTSEAFIRSVGSAIQQAIQAATPGAVSK